MRYEIQLSLSQLSLQIHFFMNTFFLYYKDNFTRTFWIKKESIVFQLFAIILFTFGGEILKKWLFLEPEGWHGASKHDSFRNLIDLSWNLLYLLTNDGL